MSDDKAVYRWIRNLAEKLLNQLKRVFLRIFQDVKTYKGFIIAFIGYDLAVQLLFMNFCPMVIVTGLPCPGCGMTRAVFYFAAGQFAKGWSMNPLGIGWLALAIYFCLMRYWLGKKPVGVLPAGGVLAVCMAVLFVCRMIKDFPGSPPINYTENNLLELFIPGYSRLIEYLTQTLARLRR